MEREKTLQTNAKQKGMSYSEQELKAFANVLAILFKGEGTRKELWVERNQNGWLKDCHWEKEQNKQKVKRKLRSFQELKAFTSFLALNESRDQQWATTLETVAKKQ